MDGRRRGAVIVVDKEEKGRTGSKEVAGRQMRKAGRKKKKTRAGEIAAVAAQRKEAGFD